MMGLHIHDVGRARNPKLAMALGSLMLVWFADCSDLTVPLTRPSYPIGGTSTRPDDLTRRIQTWMIKQRAIPKTRSLSQVKHRPKPRRPPGSIFTFQRPTKAQVGKWFEADEDPGSPRCMLQRQFNHNSVGMTNPSVSFLSRKDDHCPSNLLLTASSSNRYDHAKNASNLERSTSMDEETRWWPSLSFAPAEPLKWRVKTYRQKVGTGVDCYNRVRDAALEWEFHDGDEMGILPVTTPPARLPTNEYHINRGRYFVTPSTEKEDEDMNEYPMHQCIGAARRYVSFTSRRVLPFLPKIYSVNPVMSVFDVVDQRAQATTFTSTAYATMRGHLLRGEERVTVALRDENEDVEVEIVSVSRAAPSLGGRTIWPFIGKMQATFFELQMEHLCRIGAKHTSNSHHSKCNTFPSRRRRGQ